MSDLRGSGSIEQDADIIIFIHKNKKDDNEYKLIVAKRRDGATGFIKTIFFPEKMRFGELIN